MATPIQRIAAHVRRRRLDLQLSQRELAHRVRVPPETISRLERGQGNPTLATLTAVARGLNADVADLLRTTPGRPSSLEAIDALLAGQPPEVQHKVLAIARVIVGG